MITAQADLISGAINSIYHGAVWSQNHNIIAFSCSNQVFLYDPIKSKVFASLPTKSKRTNALEFLENFEVCTLISTDSEGGVIVWESKNENILSHTSWRVKYQEKLSSGVENLSVFEVSKGISLILTTAINGDLVLFLLDQEGLKKIDFLNFGNNVQEIMSMFPIDNETIMMVLGGLDHKIHLYNFSLKEVLEGKKNIFHYLITLKGHENAISDIASVRLEDGSFLVATTSKDSSIRLWGFVDKNKSGLKKKGNEEGLEFSNKNIHSLTINDKEYEWRLESILSLHTEPVSSVKWGKIHKEKPFNEENLILLSGSFDFSLLLWVKDAKSGIWINKYRLGQMGGNKNAFFGVAFNASYDKILAYTYHGCFYLWEKKTEDWLSLPFVSGHFARVTDIDWNSTSEYLTSCSQDQTTRVFSKWVTGNQNWHEVSRAQIHGYDINSAKNLKIKTEEGKHLLDMIICGADEKIVRLFEPTAIVANLINKLSKTKLHLYFPTNDEESVYLLKNSSDELEYKTLTEGGAQVLGLMTKAIKPIKEKYTNYFEEEEEGPLEDVGEESLTTEDSSKPPTEDYLAKHTLWPEINKLYGHGYEIQTLTANHEGTLIASSCKSQSQEHSAIFLWNPRSYSIVDRLQLHNYTVVQLEFSKDDEYLGSVSRDRQFAIFKKSNADSKRPYLLFFVDKSHTRIIWSLSFSHDSKFCVTGSRDKKMKVWGVGEEKVSLFAEKSFTEAITACSFADKPIKNRNKEGETLFLAVGLENGILELVTMKLLMGKGEISIVGRIEAFLGHSMVVNRIRFREWNKENRFSFGSCSDDHTVRVFEVCYEEEKKEGE